METMYNPIAFSPVTTLTASLSPSDTIISVANIDAFPPAPNYATIGTDADAETIRYAAKTGNQLSGCVRGVEGTAKSWEAGEYVSRNFTAKDHQTLIDNINELDAEVAQAYSPTNKPTATDVGALPIGGGNVTGTYIGTGSGRGLFASATNYVYIVSRDNPNDDNNRRMIQLFNHNDTSLALTNAITIADVTNGVYHAYKIYGEHNKALLTESQKSLPLIEASGYIVYYKNADGDVVVNFVNLYKNYPYNTNVKVGDFPVGYRPSAIRYVPCFDGYDNSTFMVTIEPDGSIQVRRSSGASGTGTINGNIVFKAVN